MASNEICSPNTTRPATAMLLASKSMSTSCRTTSVDSATEIRTLPRNEPDGMRSSSHLRSSSSPSPSVLSVAVSDQGPSGSLGPADISPRSAEPGRRKRSSETAMPAEPTTISPDASATLTGSTRTKASVDSDDSRPTNI